MGRKTVGATISRPSAPRARLTAAIVRRRHTQPGMIGSAARRSTSTVTATRHGARRRTARARAPTARARPLRPGPAPSAAAPPQANTASAPAQSTRARAPGCPFRLVQMTDDQPQRDRADRQVDQEDPAPVRVRGEHSAERRARRPPTPPTPWTASAWILGRSFSGYRSAASVCTVPWSAPPPRPWTTRKAMSAAMFQASAHSSEPRRKSTDADDQDRLAAEGVGELAVDGQGDGHGEQIAGEQPGEDGEAAEVADDLRHGGRDDGAVEGGQRHREHQRGDDGAPPPAGVRGRDVRPHAHAEPRVPPAGAVRASVRAARCAPVPSPCIVSGGDSFSLDPDAAGGWSLNGPTGGANPETASTPRWTAPRGTSVLRPGEGSYRRRTRGGGRPSLTWLYGRGGRLRHRRGWGLPPAQRLR